MAEGGELPVILLADDEPQHLKALSYLWRKKYRVLTAGSGAAALEVARHEQLNAALFDYRMPPPEGLEALGALEKMQPDCLRFLVTAHGDPEILKQAINTGSVYRFVSKPIDLPALDVDLQRALEHQASRRQLRRSEHLALAGTLASIAVHDMRNGLQGLGLIPPLIDANTPEDLRQAQEIARWAKSTMAGCIEEILSVAKGEVPTLQLAPAQLAEVAERVLAQYRGLYPGLHFLLTAQDGLPAADISVKHVERMLSNVVLNAVHVSPPGGEVRVTVARAGDGQAMTVADQGPGMSAQVQAKVLEGLFTSKGAGGVGLGIKQARSTMSAHHGTFALESQEGRGCAITMSFPASTRAASG